MSKAADKSSKIRAETCFLSTVRRKEDHYEYEAEQFQQSVVSCTPIEMKRVTVMIANESVNDGK